MTRFNSNQNQNLADDQNGVFLGVRKDNSEMKFKQVSTEEFTPLSRLMPTGDTTQVLT